MIKQQIIGKSKISCKTTCELKRAKTEARKPLRILCSIFFCYAPQKKVKLNPKNSHNLWNKITGYWYIMGSWTLIRDFLLLRNRGVSMGDSAEESAVSVLSRVATWSEVQHVITVSFSRLLFSFDPFESPFSFKHKRPTRLKMQPTQEYVTWIKVTACTGQSVDETCASWSSPFFKKKKKCVVQLEFKTSKQLFIFTRPAESNICSFWKSGTFVNVQLKISVDPRSKTLVHLKNIYLHLV